MKLWVTRDRYLNGEASSSLCIWEPGVNPKQADKDKVLTYDIDWRSGNSECGDYVHVCADGFKKAFGVDVEPDKPIIIIVKLYETCHAKDNQNQE